MKMTKIDIFSGFLGAGKTTLIKKLIAQAYAGEKMVLIENEFGEIGIDGGFLSEAGINITEMNSGCICCSLVGDFTKALGQVIDQYAPDRIIIEPSGVGKLSDVIAAVQRVQGHDLHIGMRACVVDAKKCGMYAKNFGEFFNNQIENATGVVLSHTAGLPQDKLEQAVGLVRSLNPDAALITTDWSAIDGSKIREALEKGDDFAKAVLDQMQQEDRCPACGKSHAHEHHHEGCDHDHHHEHGHDHHGHNEQGDCGHESHDHEKEDCCHDHHEHEACGHDHHEHDHHHHSHAEGHHHADDIFESIGVQTARRYTAEQIQQALQALAEDETGQRYGVVLRAKGIVEGTQGTWIHFDYVPGEPDVRTGGADVTGKICVIGSGLVEDAIKELFGLN